MKKHSLILCAVTIFGCAAMAVVDGILQPTYFVKSAIKWILFLLIPLLITKKLRFSPFVCLRPRKSAILWGLALGACTFGVICGGYALVSSFLDLSAIPEALETGAGVTRENFLWVSLYIALCNSLLEEFFFRGLAFLTLRQRISGPFPWIFSSAAFALYHAAFMKGWFSPLLYALILAALFVCGLFFNLLDHIQERVWTSWLVHLSANLAINAIGMKLLGIF